ncbi:diguanylate cyclase domain-containing protein [Vreelandella jeotgali]|uniref:diguanylate cyclase domain-containing protein n=1 Tax=Vreelandella jeotgali TaxID=553386 RepID=UPI000345E84F|nr:diguanylate cyclase [Halomonas jeotgali]
MSEYPMSRRLMTLIHAAAILLMAGYAAWRYTTGHYATLFTPLFMTLVLLAALLLHLFRSSSTFLPRTILLVATYLTILAAIWQPPDVSLIWLGLPLAATFLLLPLWHAVAISALLVPVWWLAPLHGASPSWITGFLATALLLALPRWEHARRRNLLRATDPHDGECDAYHPDALEERLHTEHQRALVLGRELAALVIHLPQLDMAGEQFGHRAQLALLTTLCHEVGQQCREYDALGRASSATFWLLLPATSESGALLVRERLTRALSRHVLVETGQLETRIGVCLPRHGDNAEDYIHRLNTRSEALASPPDTT